MAHLMRLARWWIGNTRDGSKRFGGMTSLRCTRLQWIQLPTKNWYPS